MKSGYAVIYDHTDDKGVETENYYGYFTTPDDAVRMYRELTRYHENDYSNAHLVEIVREIVLPQEKTKEGVLTEVASLRRFINEKLIGGFSIAHPTGRRFILERLDRIEQVLNENR